MGGQCSVVRRAAAIVRSSSRVTRGRNTSPIKFNTRARRARQRKNRRMAATKGSQEGTQEGIRTPMRCAILGGGTFAQNTYVPILEGDLWKFSKIAVDAVWSRSEETAKTLSLSMWHNKAEVHFGDAGLDAIIGSDSIEAVFIVLPPRPALEITLRCRERESTFSGRNRWGPTSKRSRPRSGSTLGWGSGGRSGASPRTTDLRRPTR